MTLIFMAEFTMPTDDDSIINDAKPFNPVDAARSMQGFAARAHEYVSTGLPLPPDLTENGIRELRRAQAWLEATLPTLGIPGHRAIITSDEEAKTIVGHAFIYVLRYAARELRWIDSLLRKQPSIPR